MPPNRLSQGVLVLKGSDRRNSLPPALDFLSTCPERFQKDYYPCEIDLANIRGLGPFGGVLLRFNAIESLMEPLQADKEGHTLDQLNQLLQEGQSADEEPLLAQVFRSTESFTHNPSITHQTFTRVGNDPDGYSFRAFLAILSADPYLDIASYESTLTDEGLISEAWRVYDTMGRGALWLRHTLEQANQLSHIPESDNQYQPLNEQVRIGFPMEPLDLQAFAESTLGIDKLGPPMAGQSYLYFRVYSRDCRGMFAVIHRFARTASAMPGAYTTRSVLRSSCAGVGGRAIAIVATLDDGTQDLDELSERLREHISTLMTSRIDGPIGEIDARVTRSPHPPTVCAPREGIALVTAHFECVENHLTVLQKLVQSAASVPDANPSIYHLSSRPKDSSPNSPLVCAVGWVINPAKLHLFQATIDSVVSPLCSAENLPVYSPHWDKTIGPEIKPLPAAQPLAP